MGGKAQRVIVRRIDEDAYVLTDPTHGIEFHVDHLRRERHELVGELRVACGMLGTRAIEGVLSHAAFNFSSAQTRSQRARLLGERARTNGKVDWLGLLEETCQHVLQAERTGQPAVLLRTVLRPVADDEYDVDGLRVPKHHPTIWFGDGSTFKSYLALHVASEIQRRYQVNVGYFDWELDAGQHRDRLERLTGPMMPAIHYVRCERPLIYEVDRLKRIRREHDLGFGIFDSIAPAGDGPPEAAEVAAAYSRAQRQIGLGGLHIAHINKGPAETSEQKPFGSAFWFNLARSVWNVKAVTGAAGDTMSIAFYHRKANLGPLRPAVGFDVTFDADRTHIRRANVGDVAELAAGLPLWDRIRQVVRRGPQTLAALAEELNAKPDSLDRIVRRHKNLFTKVSGSDGIQRIALVERQAS
jgi:hypothetical protein